MGIPIAGAKVIIQGFGNAGSFLAKFLHDAGAVIVGIADALGGIYNENGLDIDDLLDRRDSFGTVTNLFLNRMTNHQLLTMPCERLIPAAIENQITEDNAPHIQAKLVVEAANGPTTAKATELLTGRGIMLVPDVLASAGGVVVSYFEWVQNNQGYYWPESEVNRKLEDILIASFQQVYRTSLEKQIDMRLAAYIVGLKRMTEAVRWRGWV